MKKISISIAAILIALNATAQGSFNDSIALSRNRLKQNAMVVLGGCAAANIATGFIAANNTVGDTKYFWRMNAYWNFVNLGLAGFGYVAAQKGFGKTYSLSGNYTAQKSIERLYLVNAGLDVAYIAGGLLLVNKGNKETIVDKKDQYHGYGKSIAAQGAFLLLMDGALVLLHHKNTTAVKSRQGQVWLNVGPGIVALNVSFR